MSDYSLSVKVIGAKELQDALTSVDAFAKEEIKKAINKTGYHIEQVARANAPHLHGGLFSSIHVDQDPGHLAEVTGTNIEAKVGTNLKYAHYQEMGGYGKRVVKNYTQPGTGKLFMKKAKDDTKPLMTTFMQEAIKRIIDHCSTKGTSET